MSESISQEKIGYGRIRERRMILSRYRSLENSKVNNMATVKVAVRVRPFNQRELELNCQRIIEMENKKTRIFNTKIPVSAQDGDIGRERIKEFSYDFSHWSFDSKDENFVSQEQVFEDLGTDVVDSAFEGYNACVFAYGQTGSGKTHTMMGSLEAVGLIPRICQKIFEKMKKHKDPGTTCRTEISYLEIYNEKVKDLLKDGLSHRSLRVREHPRRGPYVEDLSKHFVMDYSDIHDLMMKGNALRSTASTNMNDVSSRSHAIFTITFVQAKFDEDTPSETVSKINLVDLAGSERADVTGATGQRLKEGGHINKSLVTLGSVISALADLSSSNSRGKNIFIPYRDSTLTWLLKDSLGGNSRTIMIATISPADVNYGETLSTLRYANRAKNIINKPTINEDPNVKLIRELRSEIAKLRALLVNNNNTNCSFVVEKLHANEAKVKVLTEAWTERWRETQKILEEQQNLALRKSGVGVILDSDMPHLVGIDDSVFSTGITFYPLKEGITYIGGEDGAQKQNIVLDGLEPEHCRIELINGQAFLIPIGQSPCYIDTNLIDKSTKLTHGCVVMLGKTIMFRYNDPAEAAKLRKEKENGSNLNLSSLSRLSFLSWSSPDLARSMENLSCRSDFDENGNGDISKYLFSSPQIMKDNSNLEKIQEKQASPFTLENSSQVRGNLELEELLAVEKLKIREELEKQKEELKLKMESEITHLEELKQQLDKEKNKYHEEFVQKQKQLEAERHCLEQWEKQLQTLASSKTFRKCDENIDTIESIDIKISEDNDKSTSESQHIPLEGFKEPNNLIHQDFLLMEQEKELNSEAILQHQDTFQESHLINSLCVENDKVEFLSEGNKLQYNKETKNLKNFDQQMNINLDLLHDNYKSFCDSPVDIKNSEWENLQKPELMLDLVYPVVEKIEQKESSFLPYEEENSEINDGLLNLDQGHSKLVQNPDLNKLYTYLQQDVIGLDPTSSNSPTSTIEHLHTLTEKYKQMSEELDVKTTEIDESNLSVETENFAHLKQSLSEISKSTEKLIKDLNLKESISSGCSTPSPESDISPLSSMMYRISSPQLTDRARIALDEVCEDVYLAIPSFIMLGSGKTQHHEYEIKILIKNETWTIFRRYKRFRELHQMMKQKFNMNNSIKLPPKRIFGSKSDEFAEERKKQLEKYLHNLLRWCFTAKECPLSSSELASKAFLCDLIPFFRKGIFDSNKLRTG